MRTGSNYVLTKTVVAADRSGRQRGSAREVVSFSGGGRGKFGKGTICQPTGSPSVWSWTYCRAWPAWTATGQRRPHRPRRSARTRTARGRRPPWRRSRTARCVPLQTAENDAPTPAAASGEVSAPLQAVIAQAEIPSPKIAGTPPLEEGTLPPERPVGQDLLCDLRGHRPVSKANQEGDLGLTVDAIERGSPLDRQ